MSDEAWFSPSGMLVRDIPQECIDQCAVGGCDNFEACKTWVDRLGFAKEMDIPVMKGYLKSTGGWEPERLEKMSDEDVAIAILWLAAWDIREQDGEQLLDYYAEPFGGNKKRIPHE